jgi:hypothetical protein
MPLVEDGYSNLGCANIQGEGSHPPIMQANLWVVR